MKPIDNLIMTVKGRLNHTIKTISLLNSVGKDIKEIKYHISVDNDITYKK